MKDRLEFFPVTSYAVVMGLTGLTIVTGKYYHLQWMPKLIAHGMLFFSLAVFLLISVMYGLKALWFFDRVAEDFHHRIRVNFFSAISISFLLQSIAFLAYWPILSLVFWWVGTIVHTILMLYTIGFWIRHNFEIQFMNPAWFIPVVGNILVPIAGVEFMPATFSFFYFAVGIFFWLVLFTIFLNRAIFHHQLPEKFIPTLFILLAPPAIGFIAYIRITQSWDFFAALLLHLTIFFVALLVVLFRSFFGIKFFISWWAFTFPMMAVTIAMAVAYQVTAQDAYKYGSWVMFSCAVLMVLFVSYHTVLKIRAHEICVNED
ncbi:SLAC1 anion channel family protein [Myxococcota bacterium]|nr:SLAC1 anion channel family protein [Myxococcota bacterium]MBU1536554.1 SLAC1 anion channel family protein [Myxococcota bacterium]